MKGTQGNSSEKLGKSNEMHEQWKVIETQKIIITPGKHNNH